MATETSQLADPVSALGERILAELGADRSNSTLTRWLAHHTAALIQAADDARAGDAPDADRRAAEARTAVLELWNERSAWPDGWPPPGAAAIVRLLDELPVPGEPVWRRGGVLARLQDLHHQVLAALVDVATADGGEIERGWLETFGDRLTTDEVTLLNRAATSIVRIDQLLAGNVAPHEDLPSAQDQLLTEPVAVLVRSYQELVYDCLQRVNAAAACDEADGDADVT